MGISAPGADVGTRGGDPVDLRFYAGVSATYDNGLQPFAVDTKGNLVVAKGLYGEEASLGAYGVHSWEHARLGLDYRGGVRRSSSRNSLSGTDQRLALDYRVQTSKRLSFQMKGTGGIFSQGLGALGGYTIPSYGVVDQPAVLLSTIACILAKAAPALLICCRRTPRSLPEARDSQHVISPRALWV